MFIKSGRARLLAAAVLIHLGLALSVYLVGRYAVIAALFDFQGTGLRFASDGIAYMSEVRSLVELLARDGLSAWLGADYPFHVKLYSVSFAILSPVFGFSTLSAEPLNLFYYIAIVCLVRRLGEETYGERAGLVAGWLVALWPSFLLHTTQLLKDPLFVAALLALLLLNARWLTGDRGRRDSLLAGVAAGALCVVLWLVRGEVWELTLAVVLIGVALVALRQVRRGARAAAWNLAGAALMLVMALGAPRVAQAVRGGAAPGGAGAPATVAVASPAAGGGGAGAATSLAERVTRLRAKFARRYPNAGSNIDAGVRLDDASALARYLPRAVAVGLFAPMPDMWLAAGVHTGRAGRVLSGAETALMYLLQLCTLYGLWVERRRLSAWLLFLVSVAGAAALGLVVINVGALYRLRYAFWMSLVVLGAGGAVRLHQALAERRRERAGETAAPRHPPRLTAPGV